MFECCTVCSLPYDDGEHVKANFVGRTTMCYKCYNEQPKVISLDFDGVIADYDGWKGSDHKGNLNKDAKEFMEKLVSLGFELYIVTSRPTKGIWKWLESNGVNHLIKVVTNMKVAAYCYLDDRAILFNNDFNEALDNIKNFVPWYKKR